MNRIQYPIVSMWILKFKPILDAYYGPFKDKKEYWVGILLVARVILLIVCITTYYETYVDQKKIAMVLILSCLLLHKAFTGPIYKSIWISVMENSLILNAIALTTTLFISSSADVQNNNLQLILAHALVGLAAIQFLFLILLKTFLLFKRIMKKRRWRYTLLPDTADDILEDSAPGLER